MAFHSVVYSSSVTGATSNTNLTPVSDNFLRVGATGYVIPTQLQVFAASAGSANATACRFSSPTLNGQGGLTHIRPLDQSLTPSAKPQVMDLIDRPLTLAQNEELTVQFSGTSGYNETAWCHVLLGNSIDRLPTGSFPIMMRGTASTTTTAGSWTALGTITWENGSLPQGTYVVTQFTVQATNGLAARLNFNNQVFRPGSVCLNAAGDELHNIFGERRCGSYGSFSNVTYPQIELFSIGSNDTSATVFMEVVKIGG